MSCVYTCGWVGMGGNFSQLKMNLDNLNSSSYILFDMTLKMLKYTVLL